MHMSNNDLLNDLQRVLITLCLLSLPACGSSLRQWEYHEILTDTPRFNSSKLVLNPEEKNSSFKLELVRCGSEIKMYMNILLLEAPPHPTENKRTTVDLIFEDDTMTVYPYLLKGGQKLLFSSEICELVIQTLCENRSFTIKMGNQAISILPHSFNDSYSLFILVPTE